MGISIISGNPSLQEERRSEIFHEMVDNDILTVSWLLLLVLNILTSDGDKIKVKCRQFSDTEQLKP